MKNINIFSKFLILLGGFILILLVFLFHNLNVSRTTLLEGRKQEIKSVTDAIISVARDYQARVDQGEIDQEAAIETYYRDLRALFYAGGTGSFFAYDDDGVITMDAELPALEGKNLWDFQDAHGNYVARDLIAASKRGGDYFRYVWSKPGKPEDQVFDKISWAAPLPWGHHIGTGLYIDDLDDQFQELVIENALFASVFFVVILGAGYWIARDISTPLGRLKTTLTRIGQGHYDDPMPGSERKDEIGKITQSIDHFRAQLKENDQLRTRQEEQKRTEVARRNKELRTLADTLEQDIKGLMTNMSQSVSNLGDNSSEVSTLIQKTSQHASEVNAATSATVENVNSVTAATEELTTSARAIGDQIQASSHVANNVSGEAVQANERVKALAQAIDRISDVVRLIEDITEQTNLLALNATIEAARAGDAGKGFAVVANEVRSLAGQTAKATTEITTQIKDIQTESQKALESVSGISHSITEVAEQANAAVSTVEQQNTAIQEIAERVARVSADTQTVSQSISFVSQNAEQTEQATQNLSSTSDHLAGESRTMEQKIDRFLNGIRTRVEDDSE